MPVVVVVLKEEDGVDDSSVSGGLADVYKTQLIFGFFVRQRRGDLLLRGLLGLEMCNRERDSISKIPLTPPPPSRPPISQGRPTAVTPTTEEGKILGRGQ